jgi:hypothetical protein
MHSQRFSVFGEKHEIAQAIKIHFVTEWPFIYVISKKKKVFLITHHDE